MKHVNMLTASLRVDHDELLELSKAFRVLLAQAAPPTGIELVEFRQAFTKQVLGHLHREDMLLYPRLLKSQKRFIAAMAQSFQDDMGGLLGAYKSWALAWPTERALKNWRNFGSDTRSLLMMLERRIGQENNRLYPLLENDR